MLYGVLDDLAVPSFKQPKLYHLSPYLGAPLRAAGRDILAFFMGDMRQEPGRDPNCTYSRCIRQTLYKVSKAEDWKAKHGIWFGQRADVGTEDYSGLLARSNFCFVLPGDGYSPRLEDSILHGCIPIIIMDGVQDKDGRKVLWGGTPYEDMFGPEGWCNAKKPKFMCPCRMDGMSGQLCDGVVEQTCVNQCTGHGVCNQGFCK
ncbi:putative glucuronosyltransferase [Tetrabaena socialis]|uniref:Putative glucuronosyltransferase n=1 Tax=Tetrabaena socialis TaxID=47790 RepID=A0A2J7ZY82_9CHLO|nr:putative glucuronosyltransferase [Tetrabaena socialis]|eukprot:PNH05223.1 putative glucuronosyltransferase [Tetrabaena socialis]